MKEEKITKDQMNDANREAQNIIMTFVTAKFGNAVAYKVADIFDKVEIDIDRDPKNKCAAYYEPTSKKIFLKENYCRENKNKLDLIHTIIHEYAHSFSHLLSRGKYVNAVVEEAFANLFAEMSINYYKEIGNKIYYISEQDNEKLAKNGYYEQDSYVEEGDFLRSIMFPLKCKGKDMYAIGEYLFGDKGNFVDICNEILGSDVGVILTKDLKNVQNQLGVEDNTNLYLPQASKKLRDILLDYPDFSLEDDFKNNNGLYSTYVPILEYVWSEKKLRHELSKKIDLEHIDESNLYEEFSKLNIEDIKMLAKKLNGSIQNVCSKWGYSDLVKLIITGWYSVNKENIADFDEIINLTGGIPYDIFQEIISDRNITNTNDIFNLAGHYNVDYESNYANMLALFNLKLGNRFSVEYYKKNKSEISYLNKSILTGLSKFDLTDEEFKKILYIYSNTFSKIGSENIYDVLDIMEKLDYSILSKRELEDVCGMGIDISNCINSLHRIDDLGLLIKIGKMPSEVRENIESFLELKVNAISNDVKNAVDTLKENGYEIENADEILECINNSDYSKIKIVPSLNTKALYAFMNDSPKSKILLNCCIDQFLEQDDSTFFNEIKNMNTCLALLDEENQNNLAMSDEMRKRLCDSMQRKIDVCGEKIAPEDKRALEMKINQCLQQIEARKLNENENQNKNQQDNRDNRHLSQKREISSKLIASAVEATTDTTRADQINKQTKEIKKMMDLGMDKGMDKGTVPLPRD